jgi:hypothetical protein
VAITCSANAANIGPPGVLDSLNVQSKFPANGDGHGGVAQQGLPISDEMQDVSLTDGKTYTVQ